MGRPVDLVGVRFGKLVVKSKAENLYGKTRWLCLCDCGTTKIIQTGSLRGKRTRSCGCNLGMKVLPKDLTGRVFGKLIALRMVSRQPPKWECRCGCGKVKVVKSTSLLMIHGVRSCGFFRGFSSRKQPFESLYNRVRQSAAKRSVPFDLSYADFISYTVVSNCHYCGDMVSWTKWNVGKKGPTNLDRKDSSLGYSKNNLVVSCTRCNKAKLDHFTYEEWLRIGKLIRQMREEIKV